MPQSSLPNELLLKIFGYARPRSLKNLRLVSKNFATLVAEELYKTVFVMPLHDPMRRLSELAQNDHLAKHVKYMVFRANLVNDLLLSESQYLAYRNVARWTGVGRPPPDMQSLVGEERAAWDRLRGLIAGQTNVLHGGGIHQQAASEALAACLNRFTNLQSITAHRQPFYQDSYIERAYHGLDNIPPMTSPNRIPILSELGDQTRVWKKLMLFGRSSFRTADNVIMKFAYSVLFEALGLAEKKVLELNLGNVEGQMWLCTTTDDWRLTSAQQQWLDGILSSGLGQVKSLLLLTDKEIYGHQPSGSGWDFVKFYLNFAQSLEHLVIERRLTWHEDYEYKRSLMGVSDTLSHIHLPKLRTFKVNHTEMLGTTFLEFVRKHSSTLETLHLDTFALDLLPPRTNLWLATAMYLHVTEPIKPKEQTEKEWRDHIAEMPSSWDDLLRNLPPLPRLKSVKLLNVYDKKTAHREILWKGDEQEGRSFRVDRYSARLTRAFMAAAHEEDFSLPVYPVPVVEDEEGDVEEESGNVEGHDDGGGNGDGDVEESNDGEEATFSDGEMD